MYDVIRRFSLPALLLLLIGTVAAQQPGDLLKQAEEKKRIEAQRLERIYADAIRNGDLIGKTNPQRAVQVLREALAELNQDTEALKAERRAEMVRKLTKDIESWNQLSDVKRTTPGPATPLPRTDPRPSTDPNKGAFDAAKDRFARDKDAKVERDRIKDDREKGSLAVQKDILASTIPSPDVVTYPRDWQDKMRKRTTGVTMTAQEKAILKVLGSPITVDYKDGMTFKDVIEDLQKRTGQNFVVDQRALEEANIKYDTPVNLSLKGVTVRTVLKRLLADFNMTYVVKDQAVQITSIPRAKDMLSVRAYYVGDLVPVVDMRLPAFLNQAQAYQTMQMLVVTITQTVEPESWEVNGKGGMGTIAFDPVRFQLIIKQTAEVHYLMGLSGR